MQTLHLDFFSHERRSAAFTFLSLFFLMTTCAMLRPIRDEMGITAGTETLPYIFTGHCVALLFLSRSGFNKPASQSIPIAFSLIVVSLLVFGLFFEKQWYPTLTAQTFFAWLGLFNVFVISLFWNTAISKIPPEQLPRFIGPVTAGGSAGALLGPIITAVFAPIIGFGGLMILSAITAALGFGFLTVEKQQSLVKEPAESLSYNDANEKTIRSAIYPISIILLILFHTILSTSMYFMLIAMMKTVYSASEDRASIFASMDVTVNAFSFAGQWLLTKIAFNKLGLTRVIIITPFLVCFGSMVWFCYADNLPVLWTIILIHRIGHNVWMRPCRELMLAFVPDSCRRRSRAAADSIMYRGGDALTAWTIVSLQMTPYQITLCVIMVAALWLIAAQIAGHLYRKYFQTNLI